jgi:hypothetical protein
MHVRPRQPHPGREKSELTALGPIYQALAEPNNLTLKGGLRAL